jgi:hypothetical protein
MKKPLPTKTMSSHLDKTLGMRRISGNQVTQMITPQKEPMGLMQFKDSNHQLVKFTSNSNQKPILSTQQLQVP